MSFPVYLRLGPIALHPHFVFEVLAYGIAFRYYLYLRSKHDDPIPLTQRWWVIIAAAGGAAVGSKALFWLEDPQQTMAHWSDPVFLLSGKTVVGGLICGLFAVEWMKKRIGVQQRTGDLFAVPLCLGLFIGRVGCFLTGLTDQTYGVATALPWGVDFGDGVSRHPTQIYEMIFMVALAIFLSRVSARPHVNGDLFKLFMVAYMGFRLLVDFLKPGVTTLGLTAIQWACAAVLLYYVADVHRWLFPQPVTEGDHGRTRTVSSR